MMELSDMTDSKPVEETRVGENPTIATNFYGPVVELSDTFALRASARNSV